MNRGEILDLAKSYVLRDRNLDYDSPESNFQDIADMINVYRRGNEGRDVTAYDVAIYQILVKICRIKTSPHKLDHWADGAGYFGCGGEVATKEPVELTGEPVAYPE